MPPTPRSVPDVDIASTSPDTEQRMSAKDKVTELKGRAKEKVGETTGNDGLRREGKADQVEAKVKQGVDDVGDKAKDAVDGVRGKD